MAAFCAWASAAQAWAPAGYTTTPPRSGFMLGISLGVGQLIATDCDACRFRTALAWNLTAGASINPWVAVMVDGLVLAPNSDSLANVTTVAAQVWVTPQIWLKGGAGIAIARRDDIHTGFAMIGTVGYEFFPETKNPEEPIGTGLDLQLRFSQGIFDGFRMSHLALMVGVTFY